MATDPSADLVLTPLEGKARTIREQLTTFHLVFVALDPFTNESAWLLPTAARILETFDQADCRVAFVMAGATPEECRSFLGPYSESVVTFPDPDRTLVKAFGLGRLPALVWLGQSGAVEGAAEGWQPREWRQVVERLAKVMSWIAPQLPTPKDPGPFAGTPALV